MGGEATIMVETEDGSVLQQFKQNASKGFNVFDYDASLSEKGIKTLEKGDIKIKKGDNQKAYLPKGSYVIKIKNGGNIEQAVFSIE